MKICESCLHHRRLPAAKVPIGVNVENRRESEDGPFYLFCSYFHSYPSAGARVSCNHHRAPLSEDSGPVMVDRPLG